MIKTLQVVIIVMLIVVTCTSGCLNSRNAWQDEFDMSERSLVPTGRNQYFILEPGFQLILESKNEKLAVTVLDETREIDGVLTRVVEEREWKNDEIIEVSRNFFAICERTKDVFYFGEEVDMYKNGKLDSHKGAWLAGKDGARAGLMMPGQPKAGMMYYQEIAHRVAMDRAEILSVDEKLETPADTFTKCLKTRETTPLNFFERDYKMYAPEIGLIQDEKLLLTKYGFSENNNLSQ